MLIINNFIKSKILFFNNNNIKFFLKTILISKNYCFKKKIINLIKYKKNIKKNFFLNGILYKKIKSGYYINKKLLFLPNNLLDLNIKLFPKKIINFKLTFKIIKLDIKNFIITRKFNFKKKKKYYKIKTNKFYLGIIKNVVSYGVFIDLGNYDGLLHISDIPSYHLIYKKIFIKNIIKIKILKFEKKIKKISLTIKKKIKKNKKQFIFKNIIYCKINKIKKNNLICYNKYIKKIFYKKNFLHCKKNDILNFYIIKIENKFILNIKYKIIKNNFNYIKYINKFNLNKMNLLIYKNKKHITFSKNNIYKLNNNYYYKKYISKIIRNDFYKIIFKNKNLFLKISKFYLKIKKNIKLLTINNFKIIKNKIYFFYKIY
ncbi:putative ribosomal protein S1 [Candidatus Carsonella ruddii CS isolate Thao2000]|uniref:Putative ribosomal protein S1 n=1 Tax=Candidatus Carsonella ruddii CS isolate Thao2000 TaxID=1202537 RepID=J7GSJ2_CARRU|nr:S1 RNA-binding domain-containing protein [Candidatus Carsonella ruddii]AFP83722.1 putative ribosomal protein S1 [Candidatus Carsonella ruddii CS isolate Thao2000]